jgi:hypothetical protein
MYCEFKNKQWWVWSSRLASLDCMPQYKVIADSAAHALTVAYGIKKMVAQKKDNIGKAELKRLKQRAYRANIKSEQNVIDKTKKLKMNIMLKQWAVSLNK